MKIFGWVAGQDGCSYYRLVLPLITLAEDPEIEVSMSMKMPDSVRDGGADIIVGQRIMKPPVVGLWKALAAQGRTLVAEHDDDLASIRDDNPALTSPASNWPDKDEWRKTWIPAMHEAMNVASMVTCTNEHLATELRQHSDNVVVLPNYIDAALLDVDQPVREPGQHLKVGWGGSPTHDKDIRAAASGIAHGLNKMRRPELVIIGHDYRKLFGYKRSSFRPWETDMGRYFGGLSDLHIGLAPLSDDHFNRSKSYIKVLEYGALGIPCIASNVGPYKQFVQHGVTGFLADNESDWTRYLRLLGSDENLRQWMGANARKLAAENTIQKNAYKWLDAYQVRMKAAA